MIGEVGKDSRIIIIKEAVRVKVPVKSEDMEFRRETTIQSGADEKKVVIPERWHNAFSVDKVLVNRNFYGVLEADPGKTITATVQVFEKTVGDRKFTGLDIFKANGARPTCTLKSLELGVGEAYPIQTSKKFICFGYR